MDALVMAAGTAVVTAMATDGWEQARKVMVGLWRRVRPLEVPAIEAELDAVRGEVLAAREAGDGAVEEGLAADWHRRLQRLLADDPSLGVELQRILDEELLPLIPAGGRDRVRDITMNASATGQGRVYQAGRDQHINDK
jgi:hypothetical protein